MPLSCGTLNRGEILVFVENITFMYIKISRCRDLMLCTLYQEAMDLSNTCIKDVLQYRHIYVQSKEEKIQYF